MNYPEFSNLEGKHAFLAPSKHGWENKNIDELIGTYSRTWAQAIGTAVHDISRRHIKRHQKISNTDKKEIKLQTIEYYDIPEYAVNRGVDFDMIFETAKIYVNDAIGYRLIPEQLLVYDKDIAFGTADTISPLDSVFDRRFLRIHDLKTGVKEVDMSQLEKYAALFCLQFETEFKRRQMTVADLEMELVIYQMGEKIIHNPTVEDIAPLMDIYRMDVKALTKLKAEES